MKRAGGDNPSPPPDKKNKNASSSSIQHMCWLDAIVYPSAPHQLLVLGKTPEETSVCLLVQDVPRVVWFVPKKHDADWFPALHAEIQTLMARYKIKGYKCKKTTKKSCFLPERKKGPVECMEVIYSRMYDALPGQEIQGSTFSHLLGSQASITEQFLLDRHLMGPCWLELRDCSSLPVPGKTVARISWCSVEWSVPDPTCILALTNPAPMLPPTLKVLGLQVSLQGSIVTSIHLTQASYSITQGGGQSTPDKVLNWTGSPEKVLLQRLCAILSSYDPDILVGHDMDALGSNLALRMQVHHVDPILRSAWGRVRRPHTESSRLPSFSGRLVCDTLVAARKLIRVCDDSLPALLSSEPPERQTPWTLAQKLGILPLTYHMTLLSGNRWSKTLQMNPEVSVAFMLLHRFYDQDYLLPEPAERAKGETFQGGLVLEPKHSISPPGLVLVLDFNSLYPSVIQEFQIDWTSEGILPRTVGDLVTERRAIKEKMRAQKKKQGEEDDASLEIRQRALKLMANSMYGCLGYPRSRFYCPEMAARVTEHGRTILEQTVQDIESLGYQVIYGDTDSAMVASRATRVEDAERIAQTILDHVHAKYRILHMELDGLLKCVLLFAKKKYAALKRVGSDSWQMEIKGMESVRRDWCGLAKDMQDQTLRYLLEHTGEEASVLILEYVARLQAEMQSNQIPLQQYIMVKELKKAPNRYSDPKPDHVQVALSRGVHRAGTLIPYVMTQGQKPKSSSSSSVSMVDVDWYMEHQILPLLTRLTEWMQKAEMFV